MTITRATRTGLVESPLLSNGHGGFGKRPEETDRPKGRHRAPGRLREHWLHLRTTTKGPGTRDTGLAMVFKLLEAAQGRWRAVNGPHLVALVRAGARFQAGKLIERPDQTPDKEADEDVTKVAA